MANLRTLLYSVTKPTAGTYPQEFTVFNTNLYTPSNGGQCCLWTVPSGRTWVKFEMWGGGGGGAGTCCCMAGRGGGSGAYTYKVVCSSVLPGCQYTICAGGTTATSPTAQGCVGNTSYVTGYGLSNFCAVGGANGCAGCNYVQTYMDHQTCSFPYCCCAYGGDLMIHGTSGQYISYTSCANSFQGEAMVAAKTVTGPIYGPGGCLNGGTCGCAWFPCAVFPGGGGMSSQSHGGSCWCGGWGAGGAVSVTYG